MTENLIPGHPCIPDPFPFPYPPRRETLEEKLCDIAVAVVITGIAALVGKLFSKGK